MQRAPQRVPQAVVVDIARRQADLALRIEKADGDRLDRRIGLDRGLEHVGVKGQQVHTIAGRAFGKDGDHVAGLQPPGNLLQHAVRIATRGPLQVQRIGGIGQPPDQRPVLHLRLRDKAAEADAVQRGNIEPGDVVADLQHTATVWRQRRRTMQFQPDAAQRHQAGLPALHGGASQGSVHLRKPHIDDPDPEQHMPEQNQQPPAGTQLAHQHVRPVRTPVRLPPAWCARGPAARSPGTA